MSRVAGKRDNDSGVPIEATRPSVDCTSLGTGGSCFKSCRTINAHERAYANLKDTLSNLESARGSYYKYGATQKKTW